MLAKVGWPQAAIIVALLVCITAIVLGGHALGMDAETLRYVLGGSAVLSTIVAWFQKAPGAK